MDEDRSEAGVFCRFVFISVLVCVNVNSGISQLQPPMQCTAFRILLWVRFHLPGEQAGLWHAETRG